MFMTMINGFVSGVGPFFLLLGLLIFVHELGHFLVAKFFNVRVETFSLGFGKKILKFQYGETTYALSLIPLGGYVKMFGDDPSAEVAPEERDRAFLHKPVMQRVAVVLAGPIMNLLFAIVIFTVVGFIGEDVAGPVVGDVPTDSAAFAAGFRAGDKITKVSGEATPTWNLVRHAIEDAGQRALEFTIERPGEAAPLKLEASTHLAENDNIFSRTRQVGELTGLVAESRGTAIGVIDPKGAAARAGLRSLDVIQKIGDRKVTYWRDLSPALADAAKAGGPIALEVINLDATEPAQATRTISLASAVATPEALGIEPSELYILQVKKDSPADRAGVKVGDKVIRVGDAKVLKWDDVLAQVKAFDAAKESLAFVIVRDGAEKTLDVRPEMTKLMSMKGQEEKRFTIGIASAFYQVGPEPVHYRVSGVGALISNGLRETVHWTEFVVMSLVRLVQGEVSAKNVGGVITIGRVASHSFAAGLATFMKTMAIISINLFLLNLLPVPVLDGGHLVFYAIEGLKGAPLSLRKMELAQQIGLMLLMFLMVFAFFNDITNLFAGR